MSHALAEACGRRPGRHLALGGCARLGDSEHVARAGVVILVPVPAPPEQTRDRHQPRPDDAPEVVAWRQRMATVSAEAVYKEQGGQPRNRSTPRPAIER